MATLRSPAQEYAREVGRFVSTIRATRALLLAVVALSTVFTVFVSPAMFLPALLTGAASGLVVHVALGWLEHSLGLLSGIYLNSQAREAGPQD